MVQVSIYDYVGPDGVNVIRSWLDGRDAKTKAKLNARLNVLEQTSRAEWVRLNTEVLQGDKDGLVAVRVLYGGVQWRMLGYDGPLRSEFTLLVCGTEHNGRYVPLAIGQVAFDRIADINTDPGARRIRHDFG